MPKPASRIIRETVSRGGNAQGKKQLQIRFFAFLPTARFVLKQLLEMLRQFRRAIGVAQFVKDHGGRVGLVQKALGNFRLAIDAGGIHRADPTAGDGGDGEAPILAVRREQLHCIAHFHPKHFGQARTDNQRTGIVAKIFKLPRDDLPAILVVLQ